MTSPKVFTMRNTFYTKDDLIYSDYKWKTYGMEDAKVSGLPDSTPFNRYKGVDILYMINITAQLHQLQYLVSGQKIERMIREKLPPYLITQTQVKDWIVENWRRY
jgi:hypothetical protein